MTIDRDSVKIMVKCLLSPSPYFHTGGHTEPSIWTCYMIFSFDAMHCSLSFISSKPNISWPLRDNKLLIQTAFLTFWPKLDMFHVHWLIFSWRFSIRFSHILLQSYCWFTVNFQSLSNYSPASYKVLLFHLGGHPCCFSEAGEKAQNSRTCAQWLGYHHRHRAEGKHFHQLCCELNTYAD